MVVGESEKGGRKRGGRPRLEPSGRAPAITVTLPPSMFVAVNEAAEEAGLRRSTWVRLQIRAGLKALAAQGRAS